MTGYPPEAWVVRLEDAAADVRAKLAERRAGSTSFTPATRALINKWRLIVSDRYGPTVAEASVNDWLMNDRPPAEVVWWHRIMPSGTRVTSVLSPGRTGVVAAPDGVDEDAATTGEELRVVVVWDDGARALVRALSLDVAAS